MVIRHLKKPVQIINMEDFSIDINVVKNNLKHAYEVDYEWDLYLLRQNKIEIIKKHLKEDALNSISEKFWAEYYIGAVTDSDLSPILQSLPRDAISKLNEIKPTRKRLVSNFNLKLINKDWDIIRLPAKEFGQEDALVCSTNMQDYRLAKRSFKELPKSLEDQHLREMLKNIAQCLNDKLDEKPIYLNIIVHHTIVFCYPNESATNSPEGVHQDGMDYIVSALVIDKKNITGGKSIVYGRDARTEILNVTLQPGQGILQPDKNSDLWHTVTQIYCANDEYSGYRSTIGFDISVLESEKQ